MADQFPENPLLLFSMYEWRTDTKTIVWIALHWEELLSMIMFWSEAFRFEIDPFLYKIAHMSPFIEQLKIYESFLVGSQLNQMALN